MSNDNNKPNNFYERTWEQDKSIDYYQKFNWKNNAYTTQERIFTHKLQEIRTQGKPIRRVLELGAGFGRMTKIVREVLNPEYYLAFEISNDQIKNAIDYMGEKEFNRVWFMHCDITQISAAQDFDLVFASEVLMHILPKDIHGVIETMVDASTDHIINIDWAHGGGGDQESDWCFKHDYPSIYERIGDNNNNNDKVLQLVEILEMPHIGQNLYHYRRRIKTAG